MFVRRAARAARQKSQCAAEGYAAKRRSRDHQS
jgi:hypothetical protein